MPDHAPAPRVMPDVVDVLGAVLHPARDEEGLTTLLLRLADGVVTVVPELDHAAVVVRTEGSLTCRVVTSGVARELVEAELARGAGPLHRAVEGRELLHAPWRLLDEAWPEYAALAARHGQRAQVCLPLADQGRAMGVLTGFSPQVSLGGESRRLLSVLALAAAVPVERRARQVDLDRALETRSTIGQAIGIVRERYDLTSERAWDYLVRQASSRETKLAEVARDLVEDRPGRHLTAPGDLGALTD